MHYAFQGGVTTSFRDGAIPITEEQYAAALEGISAGKAVSIDGGFHLIDSSVPEGPSATPTLDVYEDAIQATVDGTARTKQFRDGANLAGYVVSTIPQWAAEAQAFVAWRDGVWLYAYAELAKVQAGEREQPTITEFLAEITPIEWPVVGTD